MAELLEQNFGALFGRAQDLCSRLRLGRVPLYGRRIGLGYPRHVDFIKGIVNDMQHVEHGIVGLSYSYRKS